MTQSFAMLPGGGVSYRITGAPGLPWMVFVNALGTDMRIWEPVLSRMGGRVRALTYDMRGHGLSDLPTGPDAPAWTIASLADDLLALTDHLKIDRFILCGVSVGGLVAQQVAVRVPGRVRGLVLSNTASRIGTADVWDQRMQAVRDGGMAAVVGPTLERWFPPTVRSSWARVALWSHMLARTPVDGFLGVAGALRDADLTEAASAIQGPVQVVGGGMDGSTPPDQVRALAERIPQADLDIIPGVGHLPCVEDPDTMTVLLVEFLRKALHAA